MNSISSNQESVKIIKAKFNQDKLNYILINFTRDESSLKSLIRDLESVVDAYSPISTDELPIFIENPKFLIVISKRFGIARIEVWEDYFNGGFVRVKRWLIREGFAMIHTEKSNIGIAIIYKGFIPGKYKKEIYGKIKSPLNYFIYINKGNIYLIENK